MKEGLRYFFCLSVLFFIPLVLFCRPGCSDLSSERLAACYVSVKGPATTVETMQQPEKKSEAVSAGPNTGSNIPGWVWIAGGALLGFIAGAALIYLYSRYKVYSILKTERRKYLGDLRNDREQDPLVREFFGYLGIVAMLKKSKDDKSETINIKNIEIRQLKEQNEDLLTEIEQKEKALTVQKVNAEKRAEEEYVARQPGKPDEVSGKKTDIYFTIPESDGSFKSANARNVQEIDCFYKIEPDKSGLKGRLYFLSGKYDLRALDNIDYYLNPVCEIQNITDRTNARKILMTDPGLVIKRGDIWKIEDNNKVKIKLV
jgi:hypothetical protein